MKVFLRKLWSRIFNLGLGRKRSDYHRKVGDRYRQENGQRSGVTTTRSGLQWEVLRDANGPKPNFSDRVEVHYRGTSVDGVEFDSSYGRGKPITFGLLDVISGWREGLQLMPVGSQYRFVIPPDIAYGASGAGSAIPPFATLIFEVELIAIEVSRSGRR